MTNVCYCISRCDHETVKRRTDIDLGYVSGMFICYCVSTLIDGDFFIAVISRRHDDKLNNIYSYLPGGTQGTNRWAIAIEELLIQQTEEHLLTNPLFLSCRSDSLRR